MLNPPEKPPRTDDPLPSIWQWGPWTVFTWSTLALWLIIAVQAVLGLSRANGFPIWQSDYTIGAYPSFWLVYVCLPLAVREVWVRRRRRQSIPPHFIWHCLAIIAICAMAFHWVYGWY